MSLYAEPRLVADVNHCFFYHTITLPGIGVVKGSWDLHDLDAYLGQFDFHNKRVLDVGCANGRLSFHIESQGAAEVISFDLDKNGAWDIVPFARWESRDQVVADRKRLIDQLNNAYWLGHRLLQSKARVIYGSAYAIPREIAPVDVTVIGSILLHLRDPFLALQCAAELTQEAIVVPEYDRGQALEGPYLRLLPDYRTVEPKDTWWDISPQWLVQALGILGFEDTKISYHTQSYEGRPERCYTVVARRTASAKATICRERSNLPEA
jgi:SAM-dependent methyltransferase